MIDPMANTHPANGGHAPPSELDGCALAQRTYSMLVGDHREEGVFERLRRIERLIGFSLLAIAAPLWWMACMMHGQNAP